MNSAVARLKDEYAKRRQKNPSFSLRSYARFLGLSAAQVSQVLSGKRPLTQKAAKLAAEKLALSPREKLEFLAQASSEVATAALELRDAQKRHFLEEDQFRLVADWYHFAILSLTRLSGAKADPRWVSRRLGIGVTQANEALGRLVRLGVLSPPPRFVQLCDPIRVAPAVPSAAVRAYHRQNLELATEKLESVPFAQREYQSITLAGDPGRMPEARARIDQFLTELCELLEAGPAKEVYTLGVQLFPVTQNHRK